MEILSWEVTPHLNAVSLFNWAQVPLTVEPFYGRSLSNRKSQKLFLFVKMVEKHGGVSRHFNYIFCSKRQPYTVKFQWLEHLGNHENTLKCLNIGTPKTINFPFVPNGKLMILGVPIFEHIIVKL